MAGMVYSNHFRLFPTREKRFTTASEINETLFLSESNCRSIPNLAFNFSKFPMVCLQQSSKSLRLEWNWNFIISTQVYLAASTGKLVTRDKSEVQRANLNRNTILYFYPQITLYQLMFFKSHMNFNFLAANPSILNNRKPWRKREICVDP